MSGAPVPVEIRAYEPADWAATARAHDAARRQELAASVGLAAFLSLADTAEEEGLFDDQLWVAVLDGEAWPTGGLGLAKQMKDELQDCPPVLVLIARRADAWLATWSQADGVVAHPLDAPELTSVATGLLRRRERGEPVRRALH